MAVGGRAVIGDSITNMGAGAAYVYDLNPKTGDLTCDGAVGVADLLILLEAWGTNCQPPDCHADLTGDGKVGVADLLVLLGNWG